MKKKPCPFCGGKRLFVSKSDCSWHEPAFAYSVGCAGADCHGHIFALGHDLFKTEKEAIEAWNERAAADEIEKLLAALQTARRDALEEAARMVEGMSKVFHPSQVITDRCAAAIRALGEKE